MQQYLRDADAKQQEREVHALVRQIRKLAYEGEDVIDTYILQVQSKGQHSNGSWLMRFACFLYHTPHIYRVGKQIQLIQTSLNRVTDKLNGYGVRRIADLDRGLISSCDDSNWRQRPRIYSYDDTDGEYVVGLEEDIRKLVGVLMAEEKTQVNVVSIVGMGGSGKTTLARKLYNHPYAKECFDCMAWVFISQEWRTRHILTEILRKVGGPKEMVELHDRSSVEELVDKLRNILEKKSYLVVLDDVWRGEALEEILPALPRGHSNKGSKIVITTRNREIIQFQNHQQHIYIHEPRPLSEEESWVLFSKIVFSHQTNHNMESFEILGKKMLKKCNGLPLAVVALAGILKKRASIGQWQQVSEAVWSRVLEGSCTHMYRSVQDLLAFSYDDLPYDLKPCFLYLGVFPEDCQIPAGMLTRMWVAEGFVTAHKDISPEDVAMQRLEELSHRHMIQVVSTNFRGAIKAFRLHDLLRELCVEKAKEQGFLHIYTPFNNSAASDASAVAMQPRRAALHSSVSFPSQVGNLRSLLLLTRSSILQSSYIAKEMLDVAIVHQYFKLLRLLNLWAVKTATGSLPIQIGNLVHLRYLGIRASNITELPTSVGNLRNLLTLDYRDIDSENNTPVKIPNVLWKLVLLRNLYLPSESPWSIVELQLSALKNLRILWGAKCDGGENWLSREIPKLSTSLKKLKIVVSTQKDLEAAFSCPSLLSDVLHTFHCELRLGVALRHVKPISLLRNLNKLKLIGIMQMKLSLILPSNLVILELKDSILNDEDPMVVIGALAHLKLLRLSNSYLGTEFTCESGSFPQLEELYLASLPNLESWKVNKGAMLLLMKLEILECRKLQKFPLGLPFVATLQQLEFFGVPKEFDQIATESGWSRQRLRLPHNIEGIIEQCDSAVDISSIRKLYEQLTAGVFLNNKKQKFWVMRQFDRYYNCFMLYADVSQDRTDDLGAQYGLLAENILLDRPPWVVGECWKWSTVAESDGALITVSEANSYRKRFEVRGKFNTENLSPQVTYEVAYVIMLPESSSGSLMLAASSKLYLANGHSRRRDHNMDEKPRGEWIRIPVGHFKTSSENIGLMEFYLCHIEAGVLIEGVIIQPKHQACN